MTLDLDSLTHQWQQHWPENSPGGHWPDSDRRVRFHSLPGSKRYPQTEPEYTTILNRHYTVLTELDPGSSLLVVTSEWTNSPDTTPQNRSRRAEVEPDAVHWQTLIEDPEEQDPEFRSHRQLYISERPWRPGVLDKLLRAVADDELAGVILAPEDLRWLYHPYDGGADVILPTKADRDALKERHRDWLPR
jgi:hypothetical protein